MVEKVVVPNSEKGNIFSTAKIVSETYIKELSNNSNRHVYREMLKKTVEISGIQKMEKSVVVDFGGWHGEIWEITRALYPGKEFEYVDIDYNRGELQKSKGNKLLCDMTCTPLKDNSADVVFVTNLLFGTDILRRKVDEHPAGADSTEKKELLRILKDIGSLQEQISYLEAARALKKDGTLTIGGVMDRKEFMEVISAKDITRTGMLELVDGRFKEIERGVVVGVFVYKKMNDFSLEKEITEKKFLLHTLSKGIEEYDEEGRLLWRVINEETSENEKTVTLKEPEENIFRTARKLGEKESEMTLSLAPHLGGYRSIIERTAELSGIDKMENPVAVDFGGWRGVLGSTLEKRFSGKEFTYINLEYNSAGLRKSGGTRVLADIVSVPLKNDSADVVFITNFFSDINHLQKAIAKYPLSNEELSFGTSERDGLLTNLENIKNVQEDIVRLEAIRVLKKGGRLVGGGGYGDAQLRDVKIVNDPSGLGTMVIRAVESNKIPEDGNILNATVIVYEKTKDVETDKFIGEARDHLKFLVDSLEIYEIEGGLLWKMRKEGKI